MAGKVERIAGSFRDPSGFLFVRDGMLYRQINQKYRKDFEHFVDSGLFGWLVRDGLFISHEECDIDGADENAWKIIKPRFVPFISHPYEWCFGQLRDAAITTLEIQKRALENGMILKDASAYNIQFLDGKPICIDTLSLEIYEEGRPWMGYRQFCQHFLAPLALMAYSDIKLNQLSRIYIDGIPLDFASRLLPLRAKLKPSIMAHIVLHSKSLVRYSSTETNDKKSKFMNKNTMLALTENLLAAVRALVWNPGKTEWGEYYSETNYSSESFKKKGVIVKRMLRSIQPKIVWDMGANAGEFSEIAAEIAELVVSMDNDPAAVEKDYQSKHKNEIPLLVDLTNPSPSLGWNLSERASLIDRGPCDVALVLALIHHLVISNNLPFSAVAEFFAKITKNLIIEFVPKSDSNAQRLLLSRKDIFSNYTKEHFESSFKSYFHIKEQEEISGSERVLYLMQKR